MTRQEMEHALREDAPRVVQLRDEICWRLWCKKQLEESANDLYERQVADGFWLLEEEKWQFHHGILPDFGSTNHDETVVEFAEDFFEEDHYEPGEDKQLARSSRKALKKKLRQMIVAEVFSPPRMSQEAEERGHLSGGAFDLVTGYDLISKEDQRRCWKALRQANMDWRSKEWPPIRSPRTS